MNMTDLIKNMTDSDWRLEVDLASEYDWRRRLSLFH